MHRHYHDLTQAWGNFLDFYSNLNKARKEKDDDYVDRHLIGEELVEPDEQENQQINDDLYDNYADEQVNIPESGSGLHISGVEKAPQINNLDRRRTQSFQQTPNVQSSKNLLGEFAAEIEAEDRQFEEHQAAIVPK
jgi:hypothetical protein